MRNQEIVKTGCQPFDSLQGLISFASEPLWLTVTGSNTAPIGFTPQQEQSCATVTFRVAGVSDTKGVKTRRLRQGGAEHVLTTTGDRFVTAKQLSHATVGSATDRSYQFQLLHSLNDLMRMSGHTVNGEVHAKLGRNAIIPSSVSSGFQVTSSLCSWQPALLLMSQRRTHKFDMLQALHDCISVIPAATFQWAEVLLKGYSQAADILRTLEFCRHLVDVELQDLVYKIKLEEPAYRGWYSSRPTQTLDNDTVGGINMFSLYPFLDPAHRLHDMWRDFSARVEVQAARLDLMHRPGLSKEEQRDLAEAAALQRPLPDPAEQLRAEKRLFEAVLAQEEAKKPRVEEPVSRPPLRLPDVIELLEGLSQQAAFQALLPNLRSENNVRTIWATFNTQLDGLPASLREILDAVHTSGWLTRYVPEGALGWKRKLLGAICIRMRSGMEESAAVDEVEGMYLEWREENDRGVDAWARMPSVKGGLPTVQLGSWWQTH